MTAYSHQPRSPAAPARAAAPQRPARVLLTAGAAAVALHALLLGAWPTPGSLPLPPATDEPGDKQPMTVRQIVRVLPAPHQPEGAATPALPPAADAAVMEPPGAAATKPPVAAAKPAPTPADASTRGPARASARTAEPRAAGDLEPAPAAETAAPARAAAAASAAEGTAQAAPAAADPATPAAAQTPAAAAGPDATASATAAAAGAPPPTYRTQPAPPATMVFDFKRGLASGQAVLQWRPDAANGPYTLTLQAQAFGIALAGWNSSGHFDAAGLAPERYTETRRGREVRATNFQRAAGTISFSALAGVYPLAAGVQDRSSWMLQLGAILQANPELAQPGAQVTLVVVGTRGAPEPWVFTVMGRGELVLPGTNPPSTVADAVHLVREPRRPYDTRASIWLDPARHHLPLKVQLVVAATGEGQEFELRQLTMP